MPRRLRSVSRSRRCLAALAVSGALLGTAGAAPALSAPDPVPAAASAVSGKPYAETKLLFGTVRPNGGPQVTDKEFHAFVDTVVTPRFPDGLTVQEAQGQYRDAHGVIEHERSYELTLLYPAADARSAGAKIEQIRAAYVRRFDQESVARVDEPVRVDF
ncbi:DUF3574 domain-containing protein [Streptomyces beihaiensis]|uniref:DUF3574 domain-containing protein n=1 Tax=Streptomyces beihaiensis TaxID=2984495 RepID=A0ABT3TS95_9ACTN|nr:DUF3574 domain-containing protein [Streptomyces beihaiensis]MCX3058960.1 DUF3574 domain-containing protein [Streptomyces beihaiensis]